MGSDIYLNRIACSCGYFLALWTSDWCLPNVDDDWKELASIANWLAECQSFHIEQKCGPHRQQQKIPTLPLCSSWFELITICIRAAFLISTFSESLCFPQKFLKSFGNLLKYAFKIPCRCFPHGGSGLFCLFLPSSTQFSWNLPKTEVNASDLDALTS